MRYLPKHTYINYKENHNFQKDKNLILYTLIGVELSLKPKPDKTKI